jgi:ring-1,2-phenylacetyl-CoA epoxidase subunit PaaB
MRPDNDVPAAAAPPPQPVDPPSVDPPSVDPEGDGQGADRPWEVFIRARRGRSHRHTGTVRAPDAEAALALAIRAFRVGGTTAAPGVSIWLVPTAQLTTSLPGDRASFFEPAADKVFRHATYYQLPHEVQNL